ncbi:hypothetical protein OH799_28595 [Nocardia sp. NBC_00881]|uniref:hypothetical protein n=1 Tax=Nocardia sp. NBC_00881 TaxID=2975995 RepID=UPI003868CB4A|nr:hypothetical protein OH799_28595 [Nocardia sp. NBC_00881]
MSAIADLPEQHQRFCGLVYLQGLSRPEAAERMGTDLDAIGTVEQQAIDGLVEYVGIIAFCDRVAHRRRGIPGSIAVPRGEQSHAAPSAARYAAGTGRWSGCSP